MKYTDTVKAEFIDRPNRFVASVLLGGEKVTVHVKNTGRCRELLLPGSMVVLSGSDNPARKYRYDLISVWKDSVGWVNIDSQAPNHVMMEWLESGGKDDFRNGITCIRKEVTYGDSRFDFYLEKGERKIFIEVKGCTLEKDHQGYFPDAPTERGVKHLKGLMGAVNAGYEAYIAFVIAMEDVDSVLPNVQTHPEFGQVLDEAERTGVKILYMHCHVRENELNIVDYKEHEYETV